MCLGHLMIVVYLNTTTPEIASTDGTPISLGSHHEVIFILADAIGSLQVCVSISFHFGQPFCSIQPSGNKVKGL